MNLLRQKELQPRLKKMLKLLPNLRLITKKVKN